MCLHRSAKTDDALWLLIFELRWLGRYANSRVPNSRVKISPAELWLQKRADLEHPLGIAQPKEKAVAGSVELPLFLEPADLLVEIGCEELPPADIQSATQQLRYAPVLILGRLICGSMGAFCWSVHHNFPIVLVHVLVAREKGHEEAY